MIKEISYLNSNPLYMEIIMCDPRFLNQRITVCIEAILLKKHDLNHCPRKNDVCTHTSFLHGHCTRGVILPLKQYLLLFDGICLIGTFKWIDLHKIMSLN